VNKNAEYGQKSQIIKKNTDAVVKIIELSTYIFQDFLANLHFPGFFFQFCTENQVKE